MKTIKELLKYRIHINLNIYIGQIPQRLRYCSNCGKHRPVSEFEIGYETCNRCRSSNPDEIIKYIINEICNEYSIKPEDIQKNTRKIEILEPRQKAMYFAKMYTKLTTKQIGEKIGQKNHSTVLHSCKTVNNLMDSDPKYREKIESLKSKILKKTRL